MVKEIKLVLAYPYFAPIELGGKFETKIDFMGETINIEVDKDEMFIDLFSWYRKQRVRIEENLKLRLKTK